MGGTSRRPGGSALVRAAARSARRGPLERARDGRAWISREWTPARCSPRLRELARAGRRNAVGATHGRGAAGRRGRSEAPRGAGDHAADRRRHGRARARCARAPTGRPDRARALDGPLARRRGRDAGPRGPEGPRDLDGTSRGRLDLRALSPLIEQGRSGGSADLDLAVSGTIDAPQASGGMTLADGSLRLREIPQAITDINARARAGGARDPAGERARRWGGGTLTVAGTAGLAADARLDLQLTAREVSLRYPRDFRSRLRADLTLRGRRDSLLLAGEVHAERGLYDTDINLRGRPGRRACRRRPRQLVPPAERRARPDGGDRPADDRAQQPGGAGGQRPPARARRRALPGAVRAPRGARRRQGVPADARVHHPNGSLTYNGTLDPEIAITAETVISQLEDEDVRVTAVASGPLLRPTLDLRSDPSYSEREIASLVATGRRGVLDSPGRRRLGRRRADGRAAGRTAHPRPVAQPARPGVGRGGHPAAAAGARRRSRGALHLRQADHAAAQAHLFHGPQRHAGALLRGPVPGPDRPRGLGHGAARGRRELSPTARGSAGAGAAIARGPAGDAAAASTTR